MSTGNQFWIPPPPPPPPSFKIWEGIMYWYLVTIDLASCPSININIDSGLFQYCFWQLKKQFFFQILFVIYKYLTFSL